MKHYRCKYSGYVDTEKVLADDSLSNEDSTTVLLVAIAEQLERLVEAVRDLGTTLTQEKS